MTFNESNLEFIFDDNKWWVIKFDEDKNYKKVSDKLSGTKGIDFLGIYENNTLVFFEVKNFRNHMSDSSTKERLKKGADKLMTEIAQKVRDSVACVVAAGRNSTHNSHEWKKANNIILNNLPIKVIAWVEEDKRPNNPYNQKQNKIRISVGANSLKNKLHWLNAKVSMENISNHPTLFEGFSVSYLANN